MAMVFNAQSFGLCTITFRWPKPSTTCPSPPQLSLSQTFLCLQTITFFLYPPITTTSACHIRCVLLGIYIIVLTIALLHITCTLSTTPIFMFCSIKLCALMFNSHDNAYLYFSSVYQGDLIHSMGSKVKNLTIALITFPNQHTQKHFANR